MTLSEIAQKARDLVNADSNQYTNAKLLVDLNIWNQKTADMIFASEDESDYDDPNHGDYPTGTIPLTTNRDYFIATAERMLKIKSFSVAYDGTNYYRGRPIDSSEINHGIGPATGTTNEAGIDANFSKTDPRYDAKYGGFFLYPLASQADVDAGGKIFLEWSRAAYAFTSSDLTTGTLEPGFDLQYHPMLAYGCAYEHALAKQLPQLEAVSATLQDYEARLRSHYSRKQKDRKQSIEAYQINYK